MIKSQVEKHILWNNSKQSFYFNQSKIRTVIIDNFPALGKSVALRFIEWAQQNQGRPIALPTGKTPEHFIKWVTLILENWGSKKVAQLLQEYGIDPGKKPDMKSFPFVQIDEFYPINYFQHNSFYDYVNRYYIKGFGLDIDKALLINPNEIGLPEGKKLDDIWPDHIVDLSLRVRKSRTNLEKLQKQVLAKVDQFCTDYESKIRSLGGIGFFLGGIGPDGHIGFNVQGSDHYSTTRLCKTNYETQAAAAGDLGGIEISGNRLVITIGLKTITRTPDTTAIIMAAGQAKAIIIKKALESKKSNDVPATALQDLPNATFYLTRGAAKLLTECRSQALMKGDLNEQAKYEIITDIALKNKKKITELTTVDLANDVLGNLLKKRIEGDLSELLLKVEADYQKRIISSLDLEKNQVYLHTAPHHDDIMLGYLPYLLRLMRDQSNDHYFNYLTSGFNAVSNQFMLQQIENIQKLLKTAEFKQLFDDAYFDPQNTIFRNRDMLQYLDGLAADSIEAKDEGAARRFLRNIAEVYGEQDSDQINLRLEKLKDYFQTVYPGKKDVEDVQRLKGLQREWEADILWGYFGFGAQSVIHSRLGFYQGDIFTEEPQIERDIMPVLETMRRVKPSVVTVALDPEGSGPDTHYKVLQVVATALKMYQEESGQNDIKVWGYRNVWYRYHPSEASLFIPATLNGMAVMRDSFLKAFQSQANASFPSFEYDGPFSGLAKKIQVEQYQYMKTALGRDFFYQNKDSRIRSTRGLVFLKIMSLEDFYNETRQLKNIIEES